MLERLLWRLSWGSSGPFGNGADTTAIVRTVEQICRLGAKWIPEPDDTERLIRDRFRKIEPQTLRDLFRIFNETDAVSIEVMESVLASPALRKSLGAHLKAIENILHPPPAPAEPAESALTEQARPAEAAGESPPQTIAQLRQVAETLLLDVVRQKPHLHFRVAQVSDYMEAKKIRKALGMAKDDNRELSPILEAAAATLNKKLKTFRVEVESSQLLASLNANAEWSKAISEAWGYIEAPNEFNLSDAGLSLLQYIRSGLDSDFVLERSLSYKMGFYGREGCVEPYLHEVRRKALIDLNWEKKNTSWGERPKYRLWIGEAQLDPTEVPQALNPVFKNRIEAFTKIDVDAVRAMIYDHLLTLNPTGDDDIYLVGISRRPELEHCFPHSTSRTSSLLARFFAAITLNPELQRSYDFRDHAPVWTFSLQPKTDWGTTLAAIRAERAQPSVGERFGLSNDAAKLLTWIEQLPDDAKLLGRLTPVVEDANEQWIGLKYPWSNDNTAAYLQLLIDEINDRTDYELKLQPWREWNSAKSRIIIKSTKSGIAQELLKRLDHVCARLEAALPNK